MRKGEEGGVRDCGRCRVESVNGRRVFAMPDDPSRGAPGVLERGKQTPQEIKVGDRLWLVYRWNSSGGRYELKRGFREAK